MAAIERDAWHARFVRCGVRGNHGAALRARQSVSRSIIALVAMLALACTGATAPAETDAAAPDVGIPIDAAREARDASIEDDLPDALPAEPVLPPQFWVASFDTVELPIRTVDIAIALDARAESGSVRAVMGANGMTTSMSLDIVEPGRLRVPTPFDVGTNLFESSCSSPMARVSEALLLFEDRDGLEGLETLVQVQGLVALHLGDGGGMPLPFAASVEPDLTAPRLVIHPEHPLAGERITFVASEPVDPSFVPYVEAEGLQFALTPVSDRASASSWWLDVAMLPPSVYVLSAHGELRDLAGHSALLPDLTFDSRSGGVLDDPTFETSLAGVVAESVRGVEGDEAPLEGSRSLFVEGRSILTIAVPPGARRVRVMLRAHGSTIGTLANPWVEMLGADGTLLDRTDVYLPLELAGTVPGFSAQSAVDSVNLALPDGASTAFLEIDPWGPRGAACAPGSAIPRSEPLGMTIDAIQVR